jgi:hypothetical protein
MVAPSSRLSPSREREFPDGHQLVMIPSVVPRPLSHGFRSSEISDIDTGHSQLLDIVVCFQRAVGEAGGKQQTLFKKPGMRIHGISPDVPSSVFPFSIRLRWRTKGILFAIKSSLEFLWNCKLDTEISMRICRGKRGSTQAWLFPETNLPYALLPRQKDLCLCPLLSVLTTCVRPWRLQLILSCFSFSSYTDAGSLDRAWVDEINEGFAMRTQS